VQALWGEEYFEVGRILGNAARCTNAKGAKHW
jgi:hypothetical protein